MKKFKEGDRVVAYNPGVDKWKDNPCTGVICGLEGKAYGIWSDNSNQLRTWNEEFIELEAVYNSPLMKALK